MHLQSIPLRHILFLDTETVPLSPDYKKLDKIDQKLWDKKAQWLGDKEDSAAEKYNRAGIYAEFGKIVCITIGMVDEKTKSIKLKSFSGDDEKRLLVEFSHFLSTKHNYVGAILCGHNAKEFDFPFISRRMLVHGIPLP